MGIVVHDSVSQMARLLEAPISDRPDALREIVAPLQGMFAVMGMSLRSDGPGEWDAVDLHHQQGGFRVDRDDDRYAPAVARLAEADVVGQVGRAVRAAWRQQQNVTPRIAHVETLHVVIVLGDPDDEHFVVRNAGYLGMGGIPGYVHLTIWPTDDNVDKLASCAVHELNHNLRYANITWDPATVTVGEQVIAEGLAEAYVRELHGVAAMGPQATTLTGPELDDAYVRITADIDIAGMGNLPPYVYGDATARWMGAEPVGLPDNAGYAVGLRIIDTYLAETGRSAAASTTVPARDILTAAGVPTTAFLAGAGLVLYFAGAVITVVRARWYSHVPFPLVYVAPVVGSLVVGLAA